MNNGLANALGASGLWQDPKSQYLQEYERQRMLEAMQYMQNTAAQQVAVQKPQPQPNPVLLLTGDEE